MKLHSSKFNPKDICFLKDGIAKNDELKGIPLEVVGLIFRHDSEVKVEVKPVGFTQSVVYPFWEGELYKEVDLIVLECTSTDGKINKSISVEAYGDEYVPNMDSILDYIKDLENQYYNKLNYTIKRTKKIV